MALSIRCLLYLFTVQLALLAHSSPVPDQLTATTAAATPTQLPTAAPLASSIHQPSLVHLAVSLAPTTVQAASSGQPNVVTDTGPRATGITQFGDSFRAGLGTGQTTTDSCRLGQFSYGAILANEFAVPSSDFERRECSGAVIIEVAQNEDSKDSQIDEWENADKSDVVALSIGGNDLGFADIVDGCFVRIHRANSPDCQKSIDTANDKIKNGTLQSNIETALVQIINKSKNPNLKVYLTGYPAFFNVDTEYCNEVSFAFFNFGHTTPTKHCNVDTKPCITQGFRRTVNQLSTDVNSMLSAAVDRVNQEKGSNAVNFINPDASFDGHRFCESSNGQDVQEPKTSRSDTWFFLSAWPDNKLDGTLASLEDAADPSLGNANTNTTAIPPSAAVCDGSILSANYVLCAMALVNEDPTSPEYALLAQQQEEIRNGNFSASHIEWWKPTRELKTFHPRTLGQNAYAELIKADLASR